jgi:hypothetical protein
VANRSTEIGRLARRAPDLARLRIRGALRRAKGNVSAAGRLLGITNDQVQRYLHRFDLVEYRDQIRAKHGYRVGLWKSDQERIGVHPG